MKKVEVSKTYSSQKLLKDEIDGIFQKNNWVKLLENKIIENFYKTINRHFQKRKKVNGNYLKIWLTKKF